MELKVYEAKVKEFKLNDEVLLVLELQREPEKPKMSFPIEKHEQARFRNLLGKTVKITIEKVEE